MRILEAMSEKGFDIFKPLGSGPETVAQGPSGGRGGRSRSRGKSGHQEKKERRKKEQETAQAAASTQFNPPKEQKPRRRRESAENKTKELFVWDKKTEGSAVRIKEIKIIPSKRGKLSVRRLDVSTYLRNVTANQDKMNALRNGYKGQMVVDFRKLVENLDEMSRADDSFRAKVAKRISEILAKNIESVASGAGTSSEQQENEKKMFSLWLFLASNGYIPNPNQAQSSRQVGDYRYDHALIAEYNMVGREIELLQASHKEAIAAGQSDRFFFPAGIVEYIVRSDAFGKDGFTDAQLKSLLRDSPDKPFVPKGYPKKEKPARPAGAIPAAVPDRAAQDTQRAEIEQKALADYDVATKGLANLAGTLDLIKNGGMLDDQDDSVKKEFEALVKRVESLLADQRKIATLTEPGEALAAKKLLTQKYKSEAGSLNKFIS